jgi:hypothetical protein
MTRLLVALVAAAAVAGGNWYVLTLVLGHPVAITPYAAWLVAAPFVLALLVIAVSPAKAPAAERPDAAGPPPPPPGPTLEDGALRLLGLLQEEGRLVDFLEEDVTPYDDEQIGAATRGIHEACRKALRERVTLEPILPGAEGDAVTVEPGFDPAAIRLVGNVTGAPPVRGVLRHGGWRVKKVTIAPRTGYDARVLAPAEVEIA